MPVEKVRDFIDAKKQLGSKMGVCPLAGEDLTGKFVSCKFQHRQDECPRADKKPEICTGFCILTTPAGRNSMEEVSGILECPILEITRTFGNEETKVIVPPEVRGRIVIIYNPGNKNPNDRWVEDMQIAQAAKLGKARQIVLVAPDGVYSRQDEQDEPGASVTAAAFMDTMKFFGVDRYVTVEYHSPKSKTVFGESSGDDLHANFLIDEAIEDICKTEGTCNPDDFMIAGPDAGSQKRVNRVAKHLGFENKGLAIKDRDPITGKLKLMGFVGDPEGKIVIFYDDIIDSFGSGEETINFVLEKGAKAVYFVAPHPVFSGSAAERIHSSNVKKVYTTDFIDNSDIVKEDDDKIKIVDGGKFLAHVFCNLHCDDELLSFR
jgi:ribose-phosphate pyrophosphokinase